MYADRYGVHNVELQHSHIPSTEDAWLREFRTRLARTKSQVTNINLEFGPMNITAASPIQRIQAIDLTKQWINHAVVLGSPRVMIDQGKPTDANKQIAIDTLKIMGDYGKSKGVKVAMEDRGSDANYELLVEIIEGSGTYANCDIGNFPDKTTPARRHAGDVPTHRRQLPREAARRSVRPADRPEADEDARLRGPLLESRRARA